MRIEIGHRLKEERERLNLTQPELVSVGGGSKRSLIDWESGKLLPNTEFLAAVAAIGVDVLYVLTGVRSTASQVDITPEEQALLDNYRNADEDGKKAAHRVLDALAKSKPNGKKSA